MTEEREAMQNEHGLQGGQSLTLMLGDCLDALKSISDKSVDMVLCDPPYGVTRNAWDTVVPIDAMWAELMRVAKDNACLAIHCDGMYMARLMVANAKHYRYSLIWRKPQASDFLNAGRKPMKNHESIAIFYRRQLPYNKQWTWGKPYKRGRKSSSTNYGTFAYKRTISDGRRNPVTVLDFPRDAEKLHPTQKPVALEAWLVRTYTDLGAVVLDPFMGSGSAGVAAVREGRKFIGIEKDAGYFEMAKERIERELARTAQGP